MRTARSLLSFFQLQASGLEDLLNHHDDVECHLTEAKKSIKTLIDRLHKTEEELRNEKAAHQKTQKSLHQAQKDLTHERELHGKTKEKLAKVEKDLKAEKDLHAKTQERLAKSEKDLKSERDSHAATKRELAVKCEELESTELTLKNTKNDLEKALADLRETTDLFEDAKTDYASANERASDWESEWKAVDLEVQRLNGVKERLEEDNRKLLTKNNDLVKEREALTPGKSSTTAPIKDTSAAFFQSDSRKKGRYYIDTIQYGGDVYTNKLEIVRKVLDAAVSGKGFEVTNDFFGGDPWHGKTKTMTIAYTLDGKGPFKYIYVKEKKWAKFDAWSPPFFRERGEQEGMGGTDICNIGSSVLGIGSLFRSTWALYVLCIVSVYLWHT